MAVCKDIEVIKEIAGGKVRKVYFFYGPEQYKVRELTQSLEKELAGRASRELFDAGDWKVEDFLAASGNLSLFDAAKLLIVRGADAISAKEWETLATMLREPPDSATIVFQAENLDNRKKHAQLLTKAGAEIAVVRCEFPDEQEFFARARKFAERRKKKISTGACQLLWDRIGPSLFELDQAIEKAALFAADNATVEAEHVEAVVARTRQEVVFAFSDAVNLGDRKAALECLSVLHAQGEEPIAIVALLARQYRWMLEIALRLEGRERAEDINRALGLFPKLAKALHLGVKRLGKADVLRGLATLKAADRSLKSTMEPGRLVLERMTLELFAKGPK